MADFASIAGFEQTTTGITTWDTLFETSQDYTRQGAAGLTPEPGNIYGVYIEAVTQDIYVRITGPHNKPDGTFFVNDSDATGIRLKAGSPGQEFFVSGKPHSGGITKVEVQAVAAGAKVTWYPTVT